MSSLADLFAILCQLWLDETLRGRNRKVVRLVDISSCACGSAPKMMILDMLFLVLSFKLGTNYVFDES